MPAGPSPVPVAEKGERRTASPALYSGNVYLKRVPCCHFSSGWQPGCATQLSTLLLHRDRLALPTWQRQAGKGEGSISTPTSSQHGTGTSRSSGSGAAASPRTFETQSRQWAVPSVPVLSLLTLCTLVSPHEGLVMLKPTAIPLPAPTRGAARLPARLHIPIPAQSHVSGWETWCFPGGRCAHRSRAAPPAALPPPC